MRRSRIPADHFLEYAFARELAPACGTLADVFVRASELRSRQFVIRVGREILAYVFRALQLSVTAPGLRGDAVRLSHRLFVQYWYRHFLSRPCFAADTVELD